MSTNISIKIFLLFLSCFQTRLQFHAGPVCRQVWQGERRHVTNGRNWFTFDASSRAYKGQFRAILYTIACEWVSFLFSAVTIPFAIITCKFHYRLSSKKALFHQGNIEWYSSTASRLKRMFYLLHANIVYS